jgi:hypothetical protein
MVNIRRLIPGTWKTLHSQGPHKPNHPTAKKINQRKIFLLNFWYNIYQQKVLAYYCLLGHFVCQCEGSLSVIHIYTIGPLYCQTR